MSFPYLFLRLVSNHYLSSPHSNANLLQRAEVVALINTLHRFAESLEAVNEFRAMWSAMSRSDSEKLIVETEKGVKTASKV